MLARESLRETFVFIFEMNWRAIVGSPTLKNSVIIILDNEKFTSGLLPIYNFKVMIKIWNKVKIKKKLKLFKGKKLIVHILVEDKTVSYLWTNI